VEKRLIAGLAAALAVSLLVIAFLMGRMTGTRSVPTAQAPVIVQPETPHDSVSSAAEPPPVAAQRNDQLVEPLREPLPPIRQEPAAIREQPALSHAPVDAAIAAYFAKIDAIHVAGTGDPMTVAQGILGGIQSGDTSGIDSLVDSAKIALAQATSVQPPPSCAEYHRRLLSVLSEAAAGMVQMREAIVKSDLTAVTALAPQMQATQQKIEDLDRMRKQLLGL
jgi:hypothetical protein